MGEPQPPSETATPAATSKESTARGIPQELTGERRCLKFPGWEKVLHPSQPVAVGVQPPCLSGSQEQTYLLEAICNQPLDVALPEPTSPPQEPEVAHQWVPTPRFLEVAASLRGQMQEEVPKIPLVPVAVGMMMTPGITTMSASHVVHDEATRTTYLDTVTTSLGRVTLSGLEGKVSMPGPIIEDVMDLI